MKQYAVDYLKNELEYFQKAAEVQFTHFMQVFYFWTVVVTAPITAGLLVTPGSFTSDKSALPIILVLIAFIGWFLAAKMFDIRCSQLRYISKINFVRAAMFDEVKDHLPKGYIPPFLPETDLRDEAFKDFGVLMAIAMSAIDGVCLGFGLPLLQGKTTFSWCFSIPYFIVGLATYFAIILWRGPKPRESE